MKCQILFPWKKIRKKINLLSAEFAHCMLRDIKKCASTMWHAFNLHKYQVTLHGH